MISNHMARSADLKVSGFPDSATNSDIAKSIVDYFVGQNVNVLAIQQCRTKEARVTFKDRTACELIRLRCELDMGGVKVPVVPPPPPPPNWVNVVVYNYPYDAPNLHICDTLEFFGKIQEVRLQCWTNLPEVATGMRIVHINLRRSIPRFMINSYRCKVWYRGQPTYCDICKEGTHIASGCPFKGKCLSCKGIGHLARKCPNICFNCEGTHASDSCPNCRHWEQSRCDDDDFHSVASDVVAADEVDPDVSASATNGVDANVSAAYGEDGVASVSGCAGQGGGSV